MTYHRSCSLVFGNEPTPVNVLQETILFVGQVLEVLEVNIAGFHVFHYGFFLGSEFCL